MLSACLRPTWYWWRSVLAFKFMSDLFQKSTVFTIMLFSLAALTHIALSLSLLFFALVIYTQCFNFLYGISYRLLCNEWPRLSGLKQRTFISSQLLWVRSSLAGRFHTPGSLASAGAKQLSMELTGCEGSMFSWLTPVTLPGGLTSPPAIGRRPQALATWTLSSASWVALCHDSWLSLSVIQQRAR